MTQHRLRGPLLAALLASLGLNGCLLLRRGASPAQAPGDAGVAAAPVASSSTTGQEAESLTALVRAVTEERRARAAPARAGTADVVPATRAPVDGFGEGRVTRALLDDIQCRLAREKATEAWRKEADALRAALLKPPEGDASTRRSTDLTQLRYQLADVVGVDEADGRVAATAEQLWSAREEALAEIRRVLAREPADWRAALDVARGLYRQQDAAVLRELGAPAADDWRMNDVDGRAAVLAIGASLAGLPWASVDDRTPPAAP